MRRRNRKADGARPNEKTDGDNYGKTRCDDTPVIQLVQ